MNRDRLGLLISVHFFLISAADLKIIENLFMEALPDGMLQLKGPGFRVFELLRKCTQSMILVTALLFLKVILLHSWNKNLLFSLHRVLHCLLV